MSDATTVALRVNGRSVEGVQGLVDAIGPLRPGAFAPARRVDPSRRHRRRGSPSGAPLRAGALLELRRRAAAPTLER